MFKRISIIRRILKRKNSQLRMEREKYMAEKNANIILSAYIALIAEKKGKIVIPKKDVTRVLGRYRTCASACGDDYIIESVDTGNQESVKEEMCGYK